MANPLKPVTTVNALQARPGLDEIELRSPIAFENAADAIAFVAGLIAQEALSLSGLTPASEAEMEAGEEADLRAMSPLRVAQAIAALSLPSTVAGHYRIKNDGSFQLWNATQSTWHTLVVTGAAGAEALTIGAGES
jgi:hypothetical protein